VSFAGVAGAVSSVCNLTLTYGLSLFAALSSPWVIVPAVVAIAALFAYLFSIRNSKSVPSVPIVNPPQRTEDSYDWVRGPPTDRPARAVEIGGPVEDQPVANPPSDAEVLVSKLGEQNFNWNETVTPERFVAFVKTETETIPPDEKRHLFLEVAKLLTQNRRDVHRYSAVAVLTFLVDELTIQRTENRGKMTGGGGHKTPSLMCVHRQNGDEEQRVFKGITLSNARGLDVMYSRACGVLSKYLQSLGFQAKVVGSIPAMWEGGPVVSMEKIDGVGFYSFFFTEVENEEYRSFIEGFSERLKDGTDFLVSEDFYEARYIRGWKGEGDPFSGKNSSTYDIKGRCPHEKLENFEDEDQDLILRSLWWRGNKGRVIFRPFIENDSLHYCIGTVENPTKQHFPFFPSEKGGKLLRQLIWAEIVGQIIAHGDLKTSSNILIREDGQSVLIDTDEGMKIDSPEIDCSLFPILDEDMAEAIEAIDVGHVGEILGRCLMPEEIRNAMGERIAKLKTMVAQMRRNRKIIGADDWRSQKIEIAMKTRFKDYLRGQSAAYGLGFLGDKYHELYLKPKNRTLKDMGLLRKDVRDTSAEIYLREVVWLLD
jgi:hypothetical protein